MPRTQASHLLGTLLGNSAMTAHRNGNSSIINTIQSTHETVDNIIERKE